MKAVLLVLSISLLGTSYGQNLLKISESDLYGYMNSSGEILIKPQFKGAQEFSEGLAFVYVEDKYGLIDEEAKFIVEPFFDHTYPFKNGVAIVSVDSLFGLIDVTGKFIIAPEFQRLYFQSEEKIGAKKNNLWRFYSIRSGELISEVQYSFISEFSEGLASVRDKLTEKYGFIDNNGILQIPTNLTHVYAGKFHNGFAAVCDSERNNCFIDRSGKNVFNDNYYSVNKFNQGYAFVKKEGYSSGYFIDTTGVRVSENDYKRTWGFSGGYCGVRTDSSYAVINLKHETVFESKTIELRFFHNGFGFCCDYSGEKLTWCLMDTSMNLVSDLRFVKLFSVPNQNAIEFYQGDINKWYRYSKRGYINIKGKIIWKEE